MSGRLVVSIASQRTSQRQQAEKVPSIRTCQSKSSIALPLLSIQAYSFPSVLTLPYLLSSPAFPAGATLLKALSTSILSTCPPPPSSRSLSRSSSLRAPAASIPSATLSAPARYTSSRCSESAKRSILNSRLAERASRRVCVEVRRLSSAGVGWCDDEVADGSGCVDGGGSSSVWRIEACEGESRVGLMFAGLRSVSWTCRSVVVDAVTAVVEDISLSQLLFSACNLHAH